MINTIITVTQTLQPLFPSLPLMLHWWVLITFKIPVAAHSISQRREKRVYLIDSLAAKRVRYTERSNISLFAERDLFPWDRVEMPTIIEL